MALARMNQMRWSVKLPEGMLVEQLRNRSPQNQGRPVIIKIGSITKECKDIGAVTAFFTQQGRKRAGSMPLLQTPCRAIWLHLDPRSGCVQSYTAKQSSSLER